MLFPLIPDTKDMEMFWTDNIRGKYRKQRTQYQVPSTQVSAQDLIERVNSNEV